LTPHSFNASSLSSPGFRVGVSVERRAELERTNRLKQEQYAKQKTIQFSNLLERASDQIGEYVESQRNLFIVEASAPLPNGDANDASSADDEHSRSFDDAENNESADIKVIAYLAKGQVTIQTCNIHRIMHHAFSFFGGYFAEKNEYSTIIQIFPPNVNDSCVNFA
jgi:hypothetical protein